MPPSTRPAIGLFVPSTTSPWAERQWEGVVQGVRDLDLDLTCYIGGVLGSPRYNGQANVLYDFAAAKKLDGLVIWTTAIGWNVTRLAMEDFLARYRPIPVVSLEMAFPGVPSVLLDDYQGMREVVTHLIEAHGRRRIAFLRGPVTHEGVEERYRAYADVLAEHDLPIDPAIVPSPTAAWDGAGMMKFLLDEHGANFDAVAAANDTLALGAIPIIKARGIRIPEDLAVTGFDNTPETMSVSPPMTTAAPPFREMGRRAIELLIAQLSGHSVAERDTMPVRLVLRQSCGCLSPAMKETSSGSEGLSRTVELSASDEATREVSEPCMEKIREALSPVLEGSDENLPRQVWKAFAADLQGGERGAFAAVLRERMNRTEDAGRDIFGWMQALTALKRLALPWVEGMSPAMRLRADRLWSQSHALGAEMAQHQMARRDVLFVKRQTALQSVCEALITTFDIESLMDIVAAGLPPLGIAGCFLSLYLSPEDPLDGARLMLAYDERGRYPLPAGGIAFPSTELAPPECLIGARHGARLVLALYFQAEHLGFVVFEMSRLEDAAVCDVLRWQLSSALKGSLLMREAKAVASEKETLLRELQHRVKNNMGIISSIVGFESRRASLSETRDVLQSLDSRIAALGSLYDTLYDTGSLGQIDLANYLGRVVDAAIESLGADARGIAFDRELDHCPIDLKRAVSLGLIVNELVTDSLKHAFPDGGGGRIRIRFKQAKTGFRLEIADDGIGLPKGFDLEKSKGFGLNLVALLAKQLGAEFSIGRAQDGARFNIAFPFASSTGAKRA